VSVHCRTFVGKDPTRTRPAWSALASSSASTQFAPVHSLVRRYIKTAAGFLVAGIVLGVWLLVRRELVGRGPTPYEISAHTHLILVGFVMMMIFGVALWLFPRPDKADERYRPELAGAAYWLLAMGTGIRAAGELAKSSVDSTWVRWTIVASGVAQSLALVLFFYTMWPRIRAVGSKIREARGEKF
jgi:heme/copper-type cytochrome/quinol oxidase subunit 1